jgi:hypothetical protein
LSESLSSLIKIAHGHLLHFQKLTALSCRGLGSKGFHSGRHKFGLEGMTRTSTMIGASDQALPAVAGRIKNLTFYFEK